MDIDNHSISPEKQIENITQAYQSANSEFVLSSLTMSIDRIQKAFPKYGSFLMEFIQNADDEGSNRLSIDISRSHVIISNNGRQFSSEDVDSLCKVGMSTKLTKDTIGYLGVGFKSVFLISDCPEVHSGSYHFKFDKKCWPSDMKLPWQVMPIWIENKSSFPQDESYTTFEIPLLSEDYLKKLIEETNQQQLNRRVILFLRNIISLNITNTDLGTKRSIEKRIKSTSSAFDIYTITENVGNNDTIVENWLIFKTTVLVPEKVKNDLITQQWERHWIDKREIMAAFRLDSENQLIIEEQGTAHIGVFSFLPLKDIPSGLNFLIQADFITTPGRGELARDCLWNDWLAGEQCQMLISKCIPEFIKNDLWKMTFVNVLYCNDGGHPLFQERIKKPLRNFLDTGEVLVSVDGTRIKPKDALFVLPDILKIFGGQEIEELYPGKRVLNENCILPYQIHNQIKPGPSFTRKDGVDENIDKMLCSAMKKRSVGTFTRLYARLNQYAPKTLEISGFKRDSILLTSEWTLSKPESSYFPSDEIPVPEGLKNDIDMVNPELLHDDTNVKVLETLGVRKVTENDILERLAVKNISELHKNWSNLPENEKMEKVRLLKKLKEAGKIKKEQLQFLTLKTTSGKWLKPSEIVFSSPYTATHKLQEIVEKGFLDWNLDFLSDDFIMDANMTDKLSWYYFFKELGVDNIVEKEKPGMAQRIAVLSSLRYESNTGSSARERNESEKKEGYDIDSINGFKTRRIECKGRTIPNPNIELTSNETAALHRDPETYFLYVVTDAVCNPRLFIAQGNALEGVQNQILSVKYQDWHKVSLANNIDHDVLGNP